MKKIALISSLCTCANGCQQQSPPSDGVPVGGSPAAAVAAARPVDATLTVDPGHVTTCKEGDRTVAIVKWQVTKPGVETVRVEVDSDKDPSRKTFTMGGATGEATTGDWVGAGVRFHLIDGASNEELATHVVDLKPCPTPGG